MVDRHFWNHLLLVCALSFSFLQQASAQSTYTITDLGTLGGSSSTAEGINSLGQVVGYSVRADGYPCAFIYSNGVMLNLGTTGARPIAVRGTPSITPARPPDRSPSPGISLNTRYGRHSFTPGNDGYWDLEHRTSLLRNPHESRYRDQQPRAGCGKLLPE